MKVNSFLLSSLVVSGFFANPVYAKGSFSSGARSISVSRSSYTPSKSSFGSINKTTTPMKSSNSSYSTSRPPQSLRDSSTIKKSSTNSRTIYKSYYHPVMVNGTHYYSDNDNNSPSYNSSSEYDSDDNQSYESKPILKEVKSPKMEAALKLIKTMPKETRIASNTKYTMVMNNYNSAREKWLDDNNNMISEGLLTDPGDASYYEKPLTEMEQCLKDSEKNCDYQNKLVDGTHSQKELDDSSSSRKWLEEQKQKEVYNNFFLILFVFGSLKGSVLAIKYYFINQKK